MNKSRILIVEEDADIAKMLRIYFDSQGYETLTANRCDDALNICRTKLPGVILLDTQLPDIDNFLDRLHGKVRTKHMPTLDFTQPFDIEDLKLQVEDTMLHSQRDALLHPVTSLPTWKLIEEQLKKVKEPTDSWISLSFGLKSFTAFKEMLGPLHLNEILFALVDIVGKVVDAYGNEDDFIGQLADDRFVIITSPDKAPKIRERINQQFNDLMGGRADLSWH